MMTVVVPSPTSSSWVRLSSIMLLAAGCDTSISRRMAWPSLVRTMPPMGSRSILSMALGPRHDRMMSATLGDSSSQRVGRGQGSRATNVLAAAMLDSWAFLPVCLSPLWVSVGGRSAGEVCGELVAARDGSEGTHSSPAPGPA